MVKSFIPKSYSETLEILSKESVKIIAGGTDLMVQKRLWADTLPRFEQDLIYVSGIDELKYVKEDESYILIGGLTPLEDVLHHSLTPVILKEAIVIMAGPGIRHTACIAGNIGNASPAGDSLPVLYALDAVVVLESIDGIREVGIEDVIVGPRRTTIAVNEIIKEIKLPKLDFSNISFDKVGGRKADAISKVSFTGVANIVGGIVLDIRLSFGAVGPTIVRKLELEQKLIGKKVEDINIDKIVKSYSPFIIPINDQRSNKEYRKQVALNLLKDFVSKL